jgi:hypothetical protein
VVRWATAESSTRAMAKKALEWLELEPARHVEEEERRGPGTVRRKGGREVGGPAGDRTRAWQRRVKQRGAGEWRDHGGGLVRENGRWAGPGKKKKEKMGLSQGNSATF